MKDTNTINNCIHPKIRLRFDTQEKFFGPGVCELLELIDETGSVQKACARMELSYSKGSKMLKKLDQVIGISIVERWTGGAGGGGARLTEAGKKLVKTYRKMETEVQKAAEDANNAALSAAQSAEDNRNTALHTLEKEQETTEKQNALDRAAAAVTASDAETLQAELDALLAVQQAGGTLTAPSDGTLVSLDLVVGQPSPAVGGQLAADADFTAEIPLEESQANLVSVGTVLHLSQSRASCDAAVQSLSAPDENGTVTAKCTLSKGAWCAGAANASATVQGEKRPCVLPASAVHKDNTGCYVLAIEQKATILGQQNIVVSLPVTVVETGDTTAAVSGALDADTQVIVSSTRAVQAGDRVKIHDAS